jgi:hypothetical protein
MKQKALKFHKSPRVLCENFLGLYDHELKSHHPASEGSGTEWSHKAPQFTIVCRLSRRAQ